MIVRQCQAPQVSKSYASATAAAAKSNHAHRRHDSRTAAARSRRTRPRNEEASVGNLVKVVGARKIWGTLKACSPTTISSTISKLLPSGNKLRLRVKRKTKEVGPRAVWWLVVHGPEADLLVLEKEWEKVNIQTSWVLEPCYMPEHTVGVKKTVTFSFRSVPLRRRASPFRLPFNDCYKAVSVPFHSVPSHSRTLLRPLRKRFCKVFVCRSSDCGRCQSERLLIAREQHQILYAFVRPSVSRVFVRPSSSCGR